MDAYERLREAYARDVIDLEEFERHVDGLLSERPYALPMNVLSIGPNGSPHAANIASVLKEAWTDAPGAVAVYQPTTVPEWATMTRAEIDAYMHKRVRALMP